MELDSGGCFSVEDLAQLEDNNRCLSMPCLDFIPTLASFVKADQQDVLRSFRGYCWLQSDGM